MSTSNVTPIREGFTTAQLTNAVNADVEASRAKYLKYAEDHGHRMIDENGNAMSAIEVAWAYIQDNQILMGENRNLRIA